MKPTKKANPMTAKSMIFGVPLVTALAMAMCPVRVQAQGNSAALTPNFQISDPCRVAVSKFEQSIGLIRHTQGNQAAAELKEKLLPAKLENAILFKDGYCGLAAYLREKKLVK